MKDYSVLCMQDQFAFDKIIQVRVSAKDEEEAKQKALNTIRGSYPNAVLAPELPGTKVVMEVGDNSLRSFVDDYIYIYSTVYKTYEKKAEEGQSLVQNLKKGYAVLGVNNDLFLDIMIVLIKQPMLVDKKCSFAEFSFMFNSLGYSAKIELYPTFHFPTTQPDETTSECLSTFIKSAPDILRFDILKLIILFFSVDGITEARKQYIYDFYRKYFEN
ncbi:MAG TPA: hypothetical protein DEQ88_01635 [Clostridiales bacterium]|nr:hypothetical protein [Clostridiales bacterium]